MVVHSPILPEEATCDSSLRHQGIQASSPLPRSLPQKSVNFQRKGTPNISTPTPTSIALPPPSLLRREIMKLQSLWPCLAALLSATVSATALTYKMQPNEKACFFTDVGQKSAKIAFYFAVGFPASQSLFSCLDLKVESWWIDGSSLGDVLSLWLRDSVVDDGHCLVEWECCSEGYGYISRMKTF
jgi:hypothetical protein